jgi:hypothetical protein
VSGYTFRLAGARKTSPTGNAAATFDPATEILHITLLEIYGMVQTYRVQLLRQPGERYVFQLLGAKKN